MGIMYLVTRTSNCTLRSGLVPRQNLARVARSGDAFLVGTKFTKRFNFAVMVGAGRSSAFRLHCAGAKA